MVSITDDVAELKHQRNSFIGEIRQTSSDGRTFRKCVCHNFDDMGSTQNLGEVVWKINAVAHISHQMAA